jgi:hypothetical protein
MPQIFLSLAAESVPRPPGDLELDVRAPLAICARVYSARGGRLDELVGVAAEDLHAGVALLGRGVEAGDVPVDRRELLAAHDAEGVLVEPAMSVTRPALRSPPQTGRPPRSR